MTIAKRDQIILNKFPEGQIGLQRSGEPPKNLSIPLGDILAESSSYSSKQGVYNFAVQGGAIGSKMLTMSAPIPAYSIIDKVIVRVQTAVAPNTALTANLTFVSAGSTTIIQSFSAGSLSTVGISQTVLTTPSYTGSQSGVLALNIAGAAATAGLVTFIVTYASPMQFDK